MQFRDTITGQASILSELVASIIEPLLQEHGLSFGAFDLMAAVRSGGASSNQAQIAKRLGISAASLTEAVQTAQRRGLLEQVRSDEDKRTRRLQLTPLGDQVFNRCLQTLREAEEALTEGIKERDLQVAVKVLHQANQNLLRHLDLPE